MLQRSALSNVGARVVTRYDNLEQGIGYEMARFGSISWMGQSRCGET